MTNRKWGYAGEKLYSACSGAIGSARTPQERLRSVAWEIGILREIYIPDAKLWERMQKFMDAVTINPGKGGEGSIPATTSQMTDDEAGKLLQEAFSIFVKVAELEAIESYSLHRSSAR